MRLWQRAASERRWPSAAELARARAWIGRVYKGAPARPRPGRARRGGCRARSRRGRQGLRGGPDRAPLCSASSARDSALVNFGESSIVAIGPPPPGAPAWAIRLRRPRQRSRRAAVFAGYGALDLGELRAERARGKAASRSHHRSQDGDAARAGRAQATALAPTGTEAEAWSKALLVDPPLAHHAILARPSVSALRLADRREFADARFVAASGWKTRAAVSRPAEALRPSARFRSLATAGPAPAPIVSLRSGRT